MVERLMTGVGGALDAQPLSVPLFHSHNGRCRLLDGLLLEDTISIHPLSSVTVVT